MLVEKQTQTFGFVSQKPANKQNKLNTKPRFVRSDTEKKHTQTSHVLLLVLAKVCVININITVSETTRSVHNLLIK